MSFTWEIISGKLFDPDGKLIAIGYSGGDCGDNPGAVNNPEYVRFADVGPIPPGTYTISPIVDKDGNAVDYENKKAPVLRLLPAVSNQMYGRAGLLIHGDNASMNRSASEGCIIVSRDIREAVWASRDRELVVVTQLGQ